MSFNYAKLLGKIKEVYGTQGLFAEDMKMSERTLSSKLNNRHAWKQSEIIKACELLGISNEKIHLYFFTL